MSLIDLMKKRYSSRSYSDKPVEKEKLDTILEAARIAPSAHNFQPVRLLVLQNDEVDKIEGPVKTHNAPVAIVVFADHNEAWARDDGKTTTDIDASIVTDHMMLTATDLDLNTLWICQFDTKKVCEIFNTPDHLEPINTLLIGYADDTPKSPDRFDKARKNLDDILL